MRKNIETKATKKTITLKIQKLEKRATPRSLAAVYGGEEVAALAHRASPGTVGCMVCS